MDAESKNSFRLLVVRDFVQRYKESIVTLSTKLLKHIQKISSVQQSLNEDLHVRLEELVLKFSTKELGTDTLSRLMQVFAHPVGTQLYVNLRQLAHTLYFHSSSASIVSCLKAFEHILYSIPICKSTSF